MAEKNQHSLSRRNFLKLSGSLGAALGAAGVLSACSSNTIQTTNNNAGPSSNSSNDTHTITDMGDTDVEVPNHVGAYADGWFAHNEISIMLNGAKGMVATHCAPDAFKWMYKVCPEMNNATATFGKDFNFENLASLNPQVIFDSSDTLRDKCTEAGIPLVNCRFNTYDQMKRSINLTASVLGGDASDIANTYNAEPDSTLNDIKGKTDNLSDDEKPSVMHGNSVYTLNLDGTGTMISTWIEACGGKNAVTEKTNDATQTFSLEQITAWNPDYIITGKPDEVDQILQDPNWQSITAIQNKNVYVNPKGVFGWDRYGVESLLQLSWASHLLHPDMFDDTDINQKVKDFYHNYLNYDLSDHEVELIMNAQDPNE